MELSSDGAALIQGFESLVLTVAPDIKGIPTGGWGHTGWYSPGVPMQNGQTLTREVAQNWFSLDTAAAVKAVNQYCAFVPLTQHQFDALVSFTYNDGAGAFAHSHLLKCLKEARFDDASLQFLRWDYCDGREIEGLANRRRMEMHYFLTPDKPLGAYV